MQVTRRQRHRLLSLGMLWGLLSMLCTVIGPFGTHDMLSLPARAGYWGVVVGGSILGSVLVARVQPQNMFQMVALWVVFAFAFALGVHLLNGFLFPGFGYMGDLFYLFGVVAVVVCVVNGMLYLVQFAMPQPVEAPVTADPTARFLRRLPLEQRGALVRIEGKRPAPPPL